MDKIEILKSRLPELYKNSSCDHDLGHIKRVVRNAKAIGEKEGADLSVLLPAAMLHDIALKRGFIKQRNAKHAVLGAKMAKPILEDCGFPQEQTRRILSAILQHSTDNPTNEPRTKEGDCLFDADKLDAITACAVGRYMQEQAFQYGKDVVSAAKDFIPWLERLKFRTMSGRILGKNRKEAIKFCEEIIKSGRL